MKQYKPTFLGRMLPSNEQKDWLEKKYNEFEELYNSMKDHAEKISDIIPNYDTKTNSYQIQLIAEQEVFDEIHLKNSKITINGNILSV